MDLTLIFHIFSTIGFGLALLLAFRIQKNLLGHPSRVFLSLFLLIYFLVGVSNVLKHGGVTNYFNRFEYFAEILFPPAFLFFIFPIFSLYIFSIYMKHDFEKRMEIEESLIESEKKFRNISEEIADGVAVIIDSRVKWLNKAFAEIFGYGQDELLDSEIDSLIQAVKPPAKAGSSKQNNSAGYLDESRYETIGFLKDGGRIAIEISGKSIIFEDQDALQIIARDITERKLAQEEITRAKMEWEQTFNTVPDMITILDSRNRILRVNKSMAEHLNSSPEELIGKNFHLLVHGDETPTEITTPESITAYCEGQSVKIYEELPDEHYLVSISPLNDDQGNYIGSVRVSHNITELKEVQKELEGTRAFLQSIIDGVTESIMVIDKEYRIRLINKVASRLHEIELPLTDSHLCYHFSHHTDKPCHGDEHPCPLQKVLETKEPVTVVHTHKRPDGTDYFVEISASPIIDTNGQVSGIIEVGRDITEKLLLEEEERQFRARLFQQQKDQSIALIAKGIAHDFNNLLGTVVGNVDLLQMGSVSKEDECGILEAIGSAAHRMSDLTTQLLAYAKGGTYKVERIVLNSLIMQTLKFSQTGSAAKIKISHSLEKGLWPIVADPNQMKQMLLNIFTNALEAMEETGGTLSVKTGNVNRESNWECPFNNVHPRGDYIAIAITNTGPEVSADIAKHIFEPFQTTKELGRGLGLAAVAGIVQNHGGCVTFDSNPEQTTFNILLPRARENGNNVGNEILNKSPMTLNMNQVH
ncbi:MAG: PAS domain S-box protein [Desulfobulbales bacterium]|nr:PAS domain S-box protein [Desulfobulbales bacterium]